jgi:hypothetical protein
MNLFEMVTKPYATEGGPEMCHHPDMIRTVRTWRYGFTRRHVYIARCPGCPALAGSVVAPPYVAPWDMRRRT